MPDKEEQPGVQQEQCVHLWPTHQSERQVRWCNTCGRTEIKSLADLKWHEYVAGQHLDDLTEQVRVLREALTAIRDYQPSEVMKDDFAYDRMVEAYREAARSALTSTQQPEREGEAR